MPAMTRRSTRPKRPVLAPEPLETRDLPATGFSFPALPVPFTAGVDLHITGTEIRFDALGLPSYMAGDIQDNHAHTIGHYQESLTPTLWNGQFIGTTGVGNFSFSVSAGTDLEGRSAPLTAAVGTITTADVSMIQGLTPAGKLLVHSVGTIVATTGVFELLHIQGGFESTSMVGLFPAFSLDTSVHFVVSGSLPVPLPRSSVASNTSSPAAGNRETTHAAESRDGASQHVRGPDSASGCAARPNSSTPSSKSHASDVDDVLHDGAWSWAA